MDIRPIHTDQDHAAALAEIERLWGAPVGSPEGNKLDALATLVADYEEKHLRKSWFGLATWSMGARHDR